MVGYGRAVAGVEHRGERRLPRRRWCADEPQNPGAESVEHTAVDSVMYLSWREADGGELVRTNEAELGVGKPMKFGIEVHAAPANPGGVTVSAGCGLLRLAPTSSVWN